MNTTVRETTAAEPLAEPPALEWALIVVHHPNTDLLGLRRVVHARSAIELGRESGALGERTLEHRLVSRQHARIEVDARGVATVSDLGSANGTWVDGVRVGTFTLHEGSLLRVGPVLLYVQRAPASYALRRSARAPVLSYSTARFVAALGAAVERGGVVIVRGAPEEAWEPYLARALEEAARGDATRVAGPDEVREGSVGLATTDEESADFSLRAWLAADAALRVRGGLFAVALDGHDASGSAAAHAGEHAQTIWMPRLTERCEELPWLAREGLGRPFGAPLELEHELVSRMLRASWPEDVRGLARWCAAAGLRARAQGTSQVLRASGGDDAYFGEPRAPRVEVQADRGDPVTTEASRSVRVARSGGWFCVRDDAPVDLRLRFSLARLLGALVKRHEQDKTAALTIDALVEAGWPGERMVSDSGANRVYVAIATLRKLGLRECIERREGAYRLALCWQIEVSRDEDPPREGLRHDR